MAFIQPLVQKLNTLSVVLPAIGLPTTPGPGLSYYVDQIPVGTPSETFSFLAANPSALQIGPALPATDGPTLLGELAQFGLNAVSTFASGGKNIPVVAAQQLLQSNQPTYQPTGQSIFKPTNTGAPRMAFSDGTSPSIFDSFFGGANQVLQSGLGQSLLQLGTQLGTSFIQDQFAPSPTSFPIGGGTNPFAVNTMAAAPAIGRAVATVGRGFFNRFPNLATAIQSLRNRGANVSRGQLWSLLKRFGPDFLVSGGILTAAAVSELSIAGPGRRRMNPGNVKALRRAHRRMKSFHHVCATNDHLLSRRRSVRRGIGSSPKTSIVSVK